MYANDTKNSFVKVYPNKAAIKQMTMKNSALNTSSQDNCSCRTCPSTPQPEAALQSKQGFDDFYLLLFILIMFCDGNDSDGSLFTLILSSLFLT